MLKRVKIWWLSLEPGEQYMYWIITFCMMLMSGLAVVVGTYSLFLGQAFVLYLMLLVAGISCFVGLFMLVVVFLTVIWPYEYAQAREKAIKDSQSLPQ